MCLSIILALSLMSPSVFSVLCLCVFMSEVLQSWRVQFDSPISTVLLFPLSFHTEAGTILLCYIWSLLHFVNLQRTSRLSVSSSFPGVEMESYNLLVASTIEMAVVYRSETNEWFCAVLLSLWRRRNCRFFCCMSFIAEMSRRTVCPRPHASWKVTSGTQ